jgi:hypothetical protein
MAGGGPGATRIGLGEKTPLPFSRKLLGSSTAGTTVSARPDRIVARTLEEA